MTKTILSILIVILFVVNTKSQTWSTQNVGSLSSYFFFSRVTSLDNTSAWGLSYSRDTVARTMDGGISWELHSTPPVNSYPPSFQALSIDTAWVTTIISPDTSWLWKTTDGANNWVKKFQAAAHCYFFHFFNSNEAVAFSNYFSNSWALFRTIDGGDSWSPVTIQSPLTNEYGMDNHHYVFGDHIWFPTTLGRIFYSSDKGQTWDVSFIDSTVHPEKIRIAFYSELEGIAIKYHEWLGVVTSIYRSHDGGVSWSIIPHTGPVAQSYFGGIFIVPNTSVVISNSGGSASAGSFFSIDSGETWILIDSAHGYGGIDGRDWNSLWAGQVTTNIGVGGVAKWDGTVLNLSRFSTSKNFSFYPNPTNGELIIRSEDENGVIYINDLSGRELIKTEFIKPDKVIAINELAIGTYTIKFISGNKINVEKFIKY